MMMELASMVAIVTRVVIAIATSTMNMLHETLVYIYTHITKVWRSL